MCDFYSSLQIEISLLLTRVYQPWMPSKLLTSMCEIPNKSFLPIKQLDRKLENKSFPDVICDRFVVIFFPILIFDLFVVLFYYLWC